LPHWRRFNCNLPTRGDDAAIQEVEWAAAEVADTIPEGEPVWVGLDVAWKWDTTAAGPGQHTLTAVATDEAGNQTTSSPVQVIVA